MSMRISMGIDTGGTYTDSVLIDMKEGSVLSKAKALTTRRDLTEGIANSIGKLDQELFTEIDLVSVSSTLATNSIVEGKGCRVGLLVIGKEFEKSIPVERTIRLEGGHDLNGEEKAPLDEDRVREFILSTKGIVDSYAVSSFLSVRNPSHENAVKDIIGESSDRPVVCGHELSSQLGFNERTVTAVLNARLIPIISDLISSVRQMLGRFGIEAPLVIMRGDGSVMGEEMARSRPVETILSGPAASLLGAKHLTREESAVVVDMEGTTTDIGLLENGLPRLDPEGAMIGGWRTRIRAVDLLTAGIGGDSRIVVHRGEIHLTSLRVIPLCIASIGFPELKAKLEAMRGVYLPRQPDHMEFSRLFQPTEFFIPGKRPEDFGLSEVEEEVLDLISDGPKSFEETREEVGTQVYSYTLRRLEEYGIVQRIGLTSTDILHVDGTYVRFDRDTPKVAVEVLSDDLGMDSEEFCATVRDRVRERIAREVISKMMFEETGKFDTGPVLDDLLDKVVSPGRGRHFSCVMTLDHCMVGIGAPVGTYLPDVANNLNTRLLLPDHMEVGNAIGASIGNVIEEVEVLVRPRPGLGGLEDPPNFMHSPDRMMEFDEFSQAVEMARTEGQKIARRMAMEAGAKDIEVFLKEEALYAGEGDSEESLIEKRIRARAVGSPMRERRPE
jgi:N-methylhydantoinase A/oxoprolinase/acetone carboxylase beta subunit